MVTHSLRTIVLNVPRLSSSTLDHSINSGMTVSHKVIALSTWICSNHTSSHLIDLPLIYRLRLHLILHSTKYNSPWIWEKPCQPKLKHHHLSLILLVFSTTSMSIRILYFTWGGRELVQGYMSGNTTPAQNLFSSRRDRARWMS